MQNEDLTVHVPTGLWVIGEVTKNRPGIHKAFWNPKTGYGSIQSALVFTDEQKDSNFLPLLGEWVELKLEAKVELHDLHEIMDIY
jgi:hypothetical protein